MRWKRSSGKAGSLQFLIDRKYREVKLVQQFVMSDSDDDKPLGARVTTKSNAHAAKPKRETSSDDEMPILQRAKAKIAGVTVNALQ